MGLMAGTSSAAQMTNFDWRADGPAFGTPPARAAISVVYRNGPRKVASVILAQSRSAGNVGALLFDREGMLWVMLGDRGLSTPAQETTSLLGGIKRSESVKCPQWARWCNSDVALRSSGLELDTFFEGHSVSASDV